MTTFGRIVLSAGIVIVAALIWLGYTFLNMPAPLMTQNATSTTPTTATAAAIIPGTSNETYTNKQLSFSVDYPSIASSSAVEYTGYLPLTETPLASFVLPRSMYSATNLAEAGVYIGATTTPAAINACTKSAPLPGESALGLTTINGAQFWVYTTQGAAVGNIYDEKIYRRLENGWCVELVELLHSGRIENYPPGKVQQFDQQKYQGILEGIVRTYQSIPTGI